MFCKCFIDNVLGIWLCDDTTNPEDNEWITFQNHMNGARGLSWELSPLSKEVAFMDLTILTQHNQIVTTLHEKPLNLHLCVLPHSAHPPGLLPRSMHGNLFRVYTL